MALKHKYIRLAETEQDYQDMIENRELEEAAVVAVTNDRDTTPDEYQFSERTTNDDNQVKGTYNALDPVNHFGGLELIWGYFGWTWVPYDFPTGEVDEEDNPVTEPLKGGHFIIIKDTTEYPRIYDGYRLQHINNLCNQLKRNTTVGYFDNSEIISAVSAFVTSSSSYYAKLNEADNVWPKLQNTSNMFYDYRVFTDWSKDTELYLPEVVNCNNLFTIYALDRCPIVNFGKLERVTAFATQISKANGNNTLYFGDYPDSIAKGLDKCYDFGTWNLTSQGDYKFKSAYNGDNTFIIPIIKAGNSSTMTAHIECNIPWTIKGSIESYGSYRDSLKLNLENLDFTKAIAPDNILITLLKNVTISQDPSNSNYIPGLPNNVQCMWLSEGGYIKGDFVFDARNDKLDYEYFREFKNCQLPSQSDSLTINNLHLWDQVELDVSSSYRMELDGENVNNSYKPFNIHIQLSPKTGNNIQRVQFSYLKLPYLLHKDEDVEFTGYDTIGYAPKEDQDGNPIKASNNKCMFYGKYENCTYHLNIDKAIDMDMKLYDGVTPRLASDIEIFFTSQRLGYDWGLDNTITKRVYAEGLTLRDPSNLEGVTTAANGYYQWYFVNSINLEYIEMPPIEKMTYRFDKCTKLDPECIVAHFQKLTGKGRTLTINETVWNKIVESGQDSIVKSKFNNPDKDITIYKNENP